MVPYIANIRNLFMTKTNELKLKNDSHAAFIVEENKSGTYATIRQVGKDCRSEDGKSIYLYLKIPDKELEIIIKEYSQSNVV